MENDVYIQVAMDILEEYHAHDVMTGISRGISHRKKTPAPKCDMLPLDRTMKKSKSY